MLSFTHCWQHVRLLLQGPDAGEEISVALPGGGVGAGAEDEISGVFRFLCDYRLTSTPTSERGRLSQYGDGSECGENTSTATTGASVAASRGAGAPPHTPLGSTTRLISESSRSLSTVSLFWLYVNIF